MSTDAAVLKRDLAEVAAEALMQTDGVLGVCVFGSVARGQAKTDSDIDMLVLGLDPEIRPSELYQAVPQHARDAGLALVYFTPERLVRHLRNAAVFGSHLKQDGWIVYDRDGNLMKLIQKGSSANPKDELRRQRKILQSLRHAERFGGRFLFPLSHVYRIGRTASYAQLIDRGVFEFNQAAAFATLAAKMPEWSQAISTIERLAPFYARTRSRQSLQKTPFDPNGPDAEAEFVHAYNAVSTIAGDGSDDAR